MQVRIKPMLFADENELLALWLADKVTEVLEGEKELAGKALEIAKENSNKV
ncbi:MAG: hypothetical protein JJE08_05440 [Proteiniphilum sp.]|nr:hypothetical protein [Proteiniphilum sp.]